MMFFGTKKNDVFIDVRGYDDFVFAGSGWDSFYSYDGDDVIFMGRGDDSVHVRDRESDVVVFGGRGFDSLRVDAEEMTVRTEGDVTYITTEAGLNIRAQGFEEVLC